MSDAERKENWQKFDEKKEEKKKDAKQRGDDKILRDIEIAKQKYKDQGFHPEQIQMFADCFQLFDRDHSGDIDTGELRVVMRSLGQDPSDEELNQMIEKVDKDGSKTLDFLEFMILLSELMSKSNGVEELIKAFKVFDVENLGRIQVAKFRHIMCNLGEKLSDTEWDELVSAADPKGTGVVDYVDFSKRLLGEKS